MSQDGKGALCTKYYVNFRFCFVNCANTFSPIDFPGHEHDKSHVKICLCTVNFFKFFGPGHACMEITQLFCILKVGFN